MSVAAETVVFKCIVANGVEIVDVTISATPPPPAVPFAIAVRLVTSVASVVAETVVNIDGGVTRAIGISLVANVVVVFVDDIQAVVSKEVVVCTVEATALMVAIVVLIGASVAINGNCGQGCLICGPSMLSNT